MKYLVYLLLGLNLAYFVWYQAQPDQTPPALKVATLPPGIEPLVLLSERPPGDPATELESTPGEAELLIETELSPQADLQDDPQADSVAPMEDSTEVPEAIEVVQVCHTIGPIKKRGEASRVRDQLSQQGYPVALRDGEIEAPTGYQVSLPAMSSKKAREVVSALKSSGMNDYYVGKRNHISLGIFSNKGKAQVRQNAVRQLGYDALLDVRYKTRKVYWIDIEENDPAQEPSEGWKQIMAGYPEIQAQQVSCE